MKPKKDDFVTIVDEPYTCTCCGRQNLKFTEITWKEDSEGQIIESSVLCQSCYFKSPEFLKVIKKTSEAYKTVDKIIDQKDRNYNKRMMRRVLKKQK